MEQIPKDSLNNANERTAESEFQGCEKNTEQFLEPEGIDASEDLEMQNYPLDSLLIRSETRTVHDICRRIRQESYIMDPDFQREFIWPSDKQSRLIESLLMRIPLPVFYLAERNDGKVIVIDGLQRLTTISNYLDNAFALRHLDKANEPFYGKYFKDLPAKLQMRLEDSQLIVYLLDPKVPERAKLDIFERVNGGAPLSRQQMRNSLYCGPATTMLKKLAKEVPFLVATGRSLNWRTMRDREFVNRFMAFYLLGVDEYKGDMDQFLADVLIRINTFDRQKIKELEDIFILSMKRCYDIWEEHCFRKHEPGQERRNVINAALFDVLSTKMVSFPKGLTQKKKEELRSALAALLENPEFQQAITYSTNSLKQVRARFAKINAAFSEEWVQP